MPLLEASCTPQGPRLPPWRPSGRKTLASLNRDFASGRQWSQKRRTTACSRARLAVSTAASASRLARASADERAAMHSIVHQQTAPQRCAPAMLLEHCDTLVSSGLLRTSVGESVLRQKRARPPPHADSSAWRRSCRALRRATVDDDGGRGSTARNARRVPDRSLKLLWRSVYSENGERAQRKLWTNKALKH